MERFDVESSFIQAVAYDRRELLLRVSFRSGAEAEYFGVPQSVVSDFLGAPSHGRFYAEHIRGRYGRPAVQPSEPVRRTPIGAFASADVPSQGFWIPSAEEISITERREKQAEESPGNSQD